MTQFLLAGTDRSGARVYWTGRAGAGFVSTERAEAFVTGLEHCERRRAMFNLYTAHHGVKFGAAEAAVDYEASVA